MVVEVEGIRLIADLVAAGAGAAVLPETAVPEGLEGVKVVSIAGLPPRRLALVTIARCLPLDRRPGGARRRAADDAGPGGHRARPPAPRATSITEGRARHVVG